MIKTYFGVTFGLILVFGGVGAIEQNDFSLGAILITITGLVLLAVSAPLIDNE